MRYGREQEKGWASQGFPAFAVVRMWPVLAPLRCSLSCKDVAKFPLKECIHLRELICALPLVLQRRSRVCRPKLHGGLLHVVSWQAIRLAMAAWIKEGDRFFYDDPLHFCPDSLCGNLSQARSTLMCAHFGNNPRATACRKFVK